MPRESTAADIETGMNLGNPLSGSLEPEVQLKISKIPHFHEAFKQEYEI